MNKSNNILTKNDYIYIIISALLITIFNNILSINIYVRKIIIPFTILLVCLYMTIRKNNYLNQKASFYLIPIMLILVSGFLEIDGINYLLNIPILMFMYTIYFFSMTNKHFDIKDNFIDYIPNLFFKDYFNNLKLLGKSKISAVVSKYTKLLIGIIVGIGIGRIVLALLMSADAYFNVFITSIIKNIRISSLIVFIISALVIFNITINVKKNIHTKMQEDKIINIDKEITIGILSVINVIFSLFLLSEISKLTNNFLCLPIEYTYASYAREGFFQLLFITIFNFIVIYLLLYKSTLIKNSNLVKKLLILLTIFSLFLIINSYYRMFLYIDNYGFTTLRLQVIEFLTMELIIFIFFLHKTINKVNILDKKIYILIFITFYIMNLYTCNNYFIYNIIGQLINK